MELTALIIAGLGLIGGGIGFFTAQAARKKADESGRIANDARADSAAALSRSADSGERIASAIEQMATRGTDIDVDLVHVFEEALGAKAEWALEERGGAHSYRLRNMGRIRAQNVRISAVPPEYAALIHGGELGDLGAGQAGAFTTSPRLTLSLKRILVSWIEADTGQQMSTDLDLP